MNQDGSNGGALATIGAGTMGRGISVAAAAGGSPVTLFDVDEGALDDAREQIRSIATLFADSPATDVDDPAAITDSIAYTDDLEAAVAAADIVIEAVTEDRQIKREAFARIERYAPEHAVLATNTSSLPLADIAADLEDPSRFCGAHWFHPAHVVPVVEVVAGEHTSDETMDAACAFLEAIGKDPVVVEKDVPGFIANRIQSAMAREAWSLLGAGVASAEDIDLAVRGTFGFRLPVLGIFEKSDHSGLDVHHTVLTELLPEIDRRTEPPEVVSDLVESGRHGVKTGRGVYDWSDVDGDDLAETRDQQLLDLLSVYRSKRDADEARRSALSDGTDE